VFAARSYNTISCWPTAEEERGRERDRRQRVTEVVDHVRQQSDGAGHGEDDQLEHGGDAQDHQTRRDGASSLPRPHDRGIDTMVAVTVVMVVVVIVTRLGGTDPRVAEVAMGSVMVMLVPPRPMSVELCRAHFPRPPVLMALESARDQLTLLPGTDRFAPVTRARGLNVGQPAIRAST
jgi:hypothetical protein